MNQCEMYMAVSDELNQHLKNISGLCTAYALSICKVFRKTGISERNQPNVASIKKKSFQEKKPQSCKIFTASHKLQISTGRNKGDPMLCKFLNPPSSSQAPSPVGKKRGMLVTWNLSTVRGITSALPQL